MSSAYLLVFHGSRDPRPQIAMEKLARLVSQSVGWQEILSNTSPYQSLNQKLSEHSKLTATLLSKKPLVDIACLELSLTPLHEQIKKFGDRALASGCNRIQVIPLFLLPGTHVMEDIPAQVAIAKKTLGQLPIDLRPHLGTHSGLSGLLAKQLATKANALILLAHGSRRPGAKQPVEVIATQLGAVSAYWAVSPRLESRVKQLVSQGERQITIVPYFLFAGGITDAIAQSVEQLQAQFPRVNLHLAEPLGASADLANLIWDLIEQ